MEYTTLEVSKDLADDFEKAAEESIGIEFELTKKTSFKNHYEVKAMTITNLIHLGMNFQKQKSK